MSFFEAPPPPPEPPANEFVRQPWWHAPRNELGVSTGLRLLLARTADVAVALVDAVAYRDGVSLALVAMQRVAGDPQSLDHPFGHFMRGHGTGELPPELLRFGVEFGDGRKATTLGGSGMLVEGMPEGPVLSQGSGGGSPDYWEQSFWLWPLPPPGSLSFVVEWPAFGIELTRHEIDAQPILDAAGGSEPLWPEQPMGGGTSTTFGFSRSDRSG
jgi:hypothetical protein